MHSDRRTRLLIAAFLAVAAHVGLMSLTVTRWPVHVPGITLPRSVSVLLTAKKTESMPDSSRLAKQHPAEKVEKETPPPQVQPIKPAAATKLPAPPKAAALSPAVPDHAAEKPVTEVKADSITRETEKQPPVPENTAANETDFKGDAEAPASSGADFAETDKQESDRPPGTVQVAYPRYEVNSPPVYPGLARKRGQEGQVILQVLVNSEGGVDNLEIESSSGIGLLDRAALAAVRKWRFEPGRRGEKKVSMWVRVPVTFKLTR